MLSSIQLFDESEGNLSVADATAEVASVAQIDSTVQYLSECLQNANLALPLSFPADVFSQASRTGLTPQQCGVVLDGIMTIWKERNRCFHAHVAATAEVERLRSDLNHATARIQDLRDEKAELEKKNWEMEMKRRAVEKENINKEKALKLQLTELDKKCVMIQRRDNQYKHELRKVEQNYEKIQEKLHKIILEKTNNSTFGGTALGSTHASKQLMEAMKGGHAAPVVQLDMSATLKPSRSTSQHHHSSSSSNNNPLPVSSADVELLQGTLATYSERMGQLVTENLSLKSSLKNLEEQVLAVLAEGEEKEKEYLSKEQLDEARDEEGNSIPHAHLCLSPRSRQLLNEFTPDCIEMPFTTENRDKIETVVKAQLQIIRQRIQTQHEWKMSSLDSNQHLALIEALKAKVDEQLEIIKQQDALLQFHLFAPERDENLQKEQEENRRLSMKVEMEDLNRRKRAILSEKEGTGNTVAGTAFRLPCASPESMRILGAGKTSADLPVLATPVVSRKQFITAIQDISPPASKAATTASIQKPVITSPTNAPLTNSKSKWLAGGVLMTPTFTPSKRSVMRAQSNLLSPGVDLSVIEAVELSDASSAAGEDAADETFDLDQVELESSSINQSTTTV